MKKKDNRIFVRVIGDSKFCGTRTEGIAFFTTNQDENRILEDVENLMYEYVMDEDEDDGSEENPFDIGVSIDNEISEEEYCKLKKEFYSGDIPEFSTETAELIFRCG